MESMICFIRKRWSHLLWGLTALCGVVQLCNFMGFRYEIQDAGGAGRALLILEFFLPLVLFLVHSISLTLICKLLDQG